MFVIYFIKSISCNLHRLYTPKEEETMDKTHRYWSTPGVTLLELTVFQSSAFTWGRVRRIFKTITNRSLLPEEYSGSRH